MNSETLDDLPLYANNIDGDFNSFYKALSTFELGVSSDWPQSIEQPQLPSQLNHQPPPIAPQPLMPKQPLQTMRQINQNRVMNADREDVNNAVGYNQAFSPCTSRELTASNMETRLPDQSRENIPVLEKLMDLNEFMPRHGSIPQLLDDSGFSKTLAHSEDSYEDSTDSMDVGETGSADHTDPNSPAYEQYQVPHKDRKEIARQASQRHRDKILKQRQALEVEAESLREKHGRLLAEKNGLREEQKKLWNSFPDVL